MIKAETVRQREATRRNRHTFATIAFTIEDTVYPGTLDRLVLGDFVAVVVVCQSMARLMELEQGREVTDDETIRAKHEQSQD
jgi:hypothetical protein